jgi:pyrroloquinoline quinone (PQQ) biosynthesis protein C
MENIIIPQDTSNIIIRCDKNSQIPEHIENIIIPQDPSKSYIIIRCDKNSQVPEHIDSIGFEDGGEEEVLKLLASTVISPREQS